MIWVGVWDYIQSTRDKVRDLERRVRLAKANVEQMHTIMSGWSQNPLFRRKEDKKDTLLNLEVCVHVYTSLGCLFTGYLQVYRKCTYCKNFFVTTKILGASLTDVQLYVYMYVCMDMYDSAH